MLVNACYVVLVQFSLKLAIFNILTQMVSLCFKQCLWRGKDIT
jgi:hypothetical protein